MSLLLLTISSEHGEAARKKIKREAARKRRESVRTARRKMCVDATGCPNCKAKRGSNCTTPDGSFRINLHQERWEWAEGLVPKARFFPNSKLE